LGWGKGGGSAKASLAYLVPENVKKDTKPFSSVQGVQFVLLLALVHPLRVHVDRLAQS